MKLRLRLSLLALPAVAALAACGEPTRFRANFAVLSDTLFAYALNGTSTSVPNALNSGIPEVVRVDGSLNFDIAFDIDDQNRALLLPVAVVGSPCARGRCRVGILEMTAPFDSVLSAPRSGYRYDTTTVATIGRTYVLESQSSLCGVYSMSDVLYSRIVIDSVVPSARRLHFRIVTDPNCGFRSLKPGVVPAN